MICRIAMDIILDLELEPQVAQEHPPTFFEASAQLLYVLIHQRFLTSRGGLATMAERYEVKDFGVCPRVGCGGAGVLPYGQSCIPGEDTVKLYCPRCDDLYYSREVGLFFCC